MFSHASVRWKLAEDRGPGVAIKQMAADGLSASASEEPLKIKGMKETEPLQCRRVGQESAGGW